MKCLQVYAAPHCLGGLKRLIVFYAFRWAAVDDKVPWLNDVNNIETLETA